MRTFRLYPGKMTVAAGAMAATIVIVAGPALASPCTDEIKALEMRLDDVAEKAGAASSGGKAVAAAREGQAVQSTGGTVAPGNPAAPREPQEARAVQQTAEAGGGGDRVMQAKATLNRARTLEEQGDASGCQGAVAEARRQLGPTP